MRRFAFCIPLILVALLLAMRWRSAASPDDLAFLTRIPAVARVSRTGSLHPTTRVIHLLDWHMIPEDLHRLDGGKNGQTYADHLAEVEAVQTELEAVLRTLGVKTVLAEGVTQAGIGTWNARVEALAAKLARQDELRSLLAEAERLNKPALAKQARDLIEEARRERLELGAVGVLAGEGILTVLPLDDEATLEASDPRKPDAQEGRKQRERSIAARALKAAQPDTVIVLGGGHDLSEEIARQSGGQAEYVRVMVGAYRRMVGE